MGLVEGDAQMLQVQYMARLSPLDMARLGQEYSQLDMDAYNQAPKAISQGLLFPYQYGQSFVDSLYKEGSWAAVNAAFAHPPQSSEQILHPERYRLNDAPRLVTLPPLTDTLGNGWRLADEDILGEFYIRLHMGQHLEESVATSAAEGWGGDRYAVYSDQAQKKLVMVWRAVWDGETDAGEFVADYTLYLDSVAGHSADATQTGRACWQMSDNYRCLSWSADSSTVVRGPDAVAVEQVIKAVGH
jgi:hypothetical protein